MREKLREACAKFRACIAGQHDDVLDLSEVIALYDQIIAHAIAMSPPPAVESPEPVAWRVVTGGRAVAYRDTREGAVAVAIAKGLASGNVFPLLAASADAEEWADSAPYQDAETGEWQTPKEPAAAAEGGAGPAPPMRDLMRHAAVLVAMFDGKQSPNPELVDALNGMEDALEAIDATCDQCDGWGKVFGYFDPGIKRTQMRDCACQGGDDA